MGSDELEDAKGSGEEENRSSQGGQPPAQPDDENRGARVDAAKAFFRAMYAGEEPAAGSGFGQPEAADASAQTACRNCEASEQFRKEAEQKSIENEQLYKRMAADFENYRKRMDRDRDEAVSLGVKKAAEAIMPALDDLDRALAYLNADTPTDKVIDSFKLVASRILQSVEMVGLKAISAVGQPFNPRFHEPVQQIETRDFPDGAVMQELRRGYMLGDKVIRPSLVNVAANNDHARGGEQAQSATSAESLEQTDPGTGASSAPMPHEDAPGRVYDLEDIPDT